jgi:prolyl-tRNA synthetase
MRYRDLQIQTQREAPNNARTAGFGWLARAGYITRESTLLPLGEQLVKRLSASSMDPEFISILSLKTIGTEGDIYFPLEAGPLGVIHCPSCGYAARAEVARFKKIPFSKEAAIPMEKVATPESSTIDSLANFLKVPKEKTAKALMYTRELDKQFVLVAIRGDMTLSDAKLKSTIEGLRPATPEEITQAGAVPGYASPVGLMNVLIVVDDLIPQSPNLVAGANETGYHLLNTNCGRDYKPEFFADLTLAKAGDPCFNCEGPLSETSAYQLVIHNDMDFQSILFALAEAHHDDRGLTLPKSAAPFDVYLMHVPGKELDTHAKAEEIHKSLEDAGIAVLFDDRDERAGVKFNDADLIGCPLRVTIGEKALKDGMVELKPRKEKENRLIKVESLTEEINKTK